jgi:catechol 2,3-dioxygenase-like lactoylglutathione lyase family enzyme
MHPTPGPAAVRVPGRPALPALLAAALLVTFLFRGSAAAEASASPAPLPVSGLSGITFLTSDFAPLRAFYGHGAGLAEQDGAGRVRFLVGSRQWIEFRRAPAPTWDRRLQHLTLEAEDLGAVEAALRGRAVPVTRIALEQGSQGLQFSDPAGNLIQVAPPQLRPAGAPAGATAFSTHLQHVGVTVPAALAEPTMAFYRDRLGWPAGFRMKGPDGHLALAKFQLPGPGHELLELIFVKPPLDRWAAGAADHINFEVASIDDAYRALHRGGIAIQGRHLPTVNGEHLWAIDIFDPELTRMEVQVTAPIAVPPGTVSAVGGESAHPLFDGRTLAGWEGNLANWRVEAGAIVAGALDRRQPCNEFLASTRDFGDFELRLQYRIEGSLGFVNGGVQFWSQRVPGSPEVSGYQADLGADKDGDLYDESRRDRDLADPAVDLRKRALRVGTWNDYRVRAQGGHIEIWLNGLKTVDYTETDPAIPRRGNSRCRSTGTPGPRSGTGSLRSRS